MAVNKYQQNYQLKNKFLPCTVPGCSVHRTATSQHCEQHSRRQEAYGNVQGRMITAKELKQSRKTVAEFFSTWQDHPAVLSALALLENWINDGATLAAHLPEERGLQELRRLFDGGVTGKEALEAVAAVWLFAHDNRYQLPDDARLTFAMSRALLGLRPQTVKRFKYVPSQNRVQGLYKKPGARVHQSIGGFLRSNLGVLMVNMVAAIEADRTLERTVKANLNRPFLISLAIPAPQASNGDRING